MKFFQWAKREQPEFFSYVKEKYDEENQGVGFDWGGLFNTAVSAYQSHQSDRLKLKELQINLQRAQQGQDPVDFRNLPQQPGAVYAQGSIPTDWNKIALYGFIGLLGVGVMMAMNKRGRR